MLHTFQKSIIIHHSYQHKYYHLVYILSLSSCCSTFFSNLSNSFRWRDLYPYGYIDTSGIGVDYPFLNGKHYPYKNIVFRLFPEGIGVQNINEIVDPTIDECE